MVEPCREELGAAGNWRKCGQPAEFILWGKLLAPEALGPRCYDHAAAHVGHRALSPGSDWAIYRLPPEDSTRDWLMNLVAVASSERAARRVIERMVERELSREARWEAEPYGPMTSLTWPG